MPQRFIGGKLPWGSVMRWQLKTRRKQRLKMLMQNFWIAPDLSSRVENLMRQGLLSKGVCVLLSDCPRCPCVGSVQVQKYCTAMKLLSGAIVPQFNICENLKVELSSASLFFGAYCAVRPRRLPPQH